jgi:hypothetical protein
LPCYAIEYSKNGNDAGPQGIDQIEIVLMASAPPAPLRLAAAAAMANATMLAAPHRRPRRLAKGRLGQGRLLARFGGPVRVVTPRLFRAILRLPPVQA